jgi:VWFA-related protein
MRRPLPPRLVLLLPALWILGISPAFGQDEDLPKFSTTVATFGTTVVVPGGLTGDIYALREGTRRLPDFRKMEPLGRIYTRQLWVPPREFTEGFPGVTSRVEWFAIDFAGRFYVAEAGTYHFQLQSDDGSKLYIDNKVRIDADGVGWLHGDAFVKLTGGIHQIRVSYFQGPRYHLYLMLSVAGPRSKDFRPFNTDEFQPPRDLDEWKYAVPDDLAADPRRNLKSVLRAERAEEPPAAAGPARPTVREVLPNANPMVPLAVRVVSDGQPVRGLTAADFVVREDGRLQQLRSASFGRRPLDIELLIDASPSLSQFREEFQRAVGQAVRELSAADRIGVIDFSDRLVERLPLTVDRTKLRTVLQKADNSPSGEHLHSLISADSDLQSALRAAEAAKEQNTAIAQTAHLLRTHARGNAGRAVVIVTDNAGVKGIPDRATRDALLRADIILCAVLIDNTQVSRPSAEAAGDVRPLIADTGGEVFFPDGATLPIAAVLRSIRDRYLLAYPATGGPAKTIRPVSVELSPAAKARFPEARVFVRRAYVAGEEGETVP